MSKILLPVLALGAVMCSAFCAHAGDVNPVQLSVSHAGPSTYRPGTNVEIVVTITADSVGGTVTALGMTDAVSDAWAFAGARPISGDMPAVMPGIGTSGRIEFAWISQPSFPYQFAYSLNVPENSSGPATISGQVEYRTNGPRQLSNPDIITIDQAPNTPPTLELAGDADMEVTQGETFQDPGYSASDTEDGDLSGQVTVSGGVDTSTIGDYTLTYSVHDSDGGTATATRIVHVVAPSSSCSIASQGIFGWLFCLVRQFFQLIFGISA